AAAVAREMDMNSVIFPRNASTFSAFGLLTADLKNSAAKSLMVPMARAVAGEVERDFNELERGSRGFLENSDSSIERVYADRWSEVRYIGRSQEVAVPVKADGVDLAAIYADFEHLHERFYGTRLGDPGEIVNLRVTITGQVPKVRASRFQPTVIGTEPIGWRRTAFSDNPLPIFQPAGLP